MKHIYSLLIVTVLLVSCGGDKEKSVETLIEKGSLQELRTKKQELSQQQSELKKQIALLESKINTLDDTKHAAIVTTITLNDTIFKHYAEIQGDVETNQNIVIYPQFSGILTQVYVKEGQKVSKGQVLAKIDDGGLSSQVAQVQAQTALAKTTFERQARLWEQKIGSEIQYLQAKTNYEASKNASDQLQSQLGKTTVRAPFSGTIDQVITDQGSAVNPGQNPLMRIVNLDDMYVKADVPETYLGKITIGSEVLVAFPSLNKTYQGKIRQVSNFINPDNRSFSIQVALPNKDAFLKPNLIATVKLNDYTSEKSILVPNNVIQKNGNNESLVFIYEPKSDSEGTAKRITIKTGKEQNGMVEVLEGLKANDIIINEGARTLRDGQEVSTKNTSNE
ncbi:RND family efflux transporter MFP subunit [Mariniflexile fucanivorans]|uniref:RND family efflux transporter MFP subunit n=1 Tax=Mariniflexile fucanivorans TaxID=264023 RepID=A0A4R1RSH4_9FLAO|nr:efflux RND transporter periplasmic adaptor subunit [Mariniflexile fucanivorans]TCL68980.1 RND family efflux transporter MFP subunit [Mariniflexile fucanivorans]